MKPALQRPPAPPDGAEIIDTHAHIPRDPARIARVIAAARASGVSRMVISSVGRGAWPAWPTAGQVCQANDDVFALCDRRPGLFSALLYLNPLLDWEREIRRRQGSPHLVGIKLWVSLKDASGSAAPCLPVLEFAAGACLPVLIHSFFRTGGTMPGELSPAEIADLAARTPAARIILAHCGGNFAKGLWAVRHSPNVWADISGCPPANGIAEAAVATLGPRRVLFGSDVPARSIASQLAKVRCGRLTARQAAAVLAGNARRLFRLPPESPRGNAGE